MTRCYLLSSLKALESTAPVMKSKLSALMQNMVEVSREINTSTVIVSLRTLKANFCMRSQVQVLLLPVISE